MSRPWCGPAPMDCWRAKMPRLGHRRQREFGHLGAAKDNQTRSLEAADQLAVLWRHPAAPDAAAVMIRDTGGNMHVVLEQKRHACEGDVCQRLTGRPARLVQRPLRHARQLRLNLLQPRNRGFHKFGGTDLPVPHEIGQCGSIKGDVVLG